MEGECPDETLRMYRMVWPHTSFPHSCLSLVAAHLFFALYTCRGIPVILASSLSTELVIQVESSQIYPWVGPVGKYCHYCPCNGSSNSKPLICWTRIYPVFANSVHQDHALLTKKPIDLDLHRVSLSMWTYLTGWKFEVGGTSQSIQYDK